MLKSGWSVRVTGGSWVVWRSLLLFSWKFDEGYDVEKWCLGYLNWMKLRKSRDCGMRWEWEAANMYRTKVAVNHFACLGWSTWLWILQDRVIECFRRWRRLLEAWLSGWIINAVWSLFHTCTRLTRLITIFRAKNTILGHWEYHSLRVRVARKSMDDM